MAKKRSIVYVDGYNFYYGMVKSHPDAKWLDFQRYFELVRPDDDIQQIFYFTAIAPEKQAARRQAVYFRALDSLEKVSLQVGRHKRKRVTCRVRDCTYTGSRRFSVQEEKETDVAIGVQIVADAYEHRAERFVIVSGDSDLLPAIRLIRDRFPEIEIIVYIPAEPNTPRSYANEMRNASHKHSTMPAEPLRRAQFPEVIQTSDGIVERPASWV
ncbi:MAG: NYN domain-containing protein [Dehalococcoidia bacterium]